MHQTDVTVRWAETYLFRCWLVHNAKYWFKLSRQICKLKPYPLSIKIIELKCLCSYLKHILAQQTIANSHQNSNLCSNFQYNVNEMSTHRSAYYKALILSNCANLRIAASRSSPKSQSHTKDVGTKLAFERQIETQCRTAARERLLAQKWKCSLSLTRLESNAHDACVLYYMNKCEIFS